MSLAHTGAIIHRRPVAVPNDLENRRPDVAGPGCLGRRPIWAEEADIGFCRCRDGKDLALIEIEKLRYGAALFGGDHRPCLMEAFTGPRRDEVRAMPGRQGNDGRDAA